MTDDELLAAYERQVRRATAGGPGWNVEQCAGGRLLVHVHPEGSAHAATVLWSELDEATVDDAIADAVARFDPLGRAWEWKTYAYDGPPDLGRRLGAAGFRPGDVEALVLGDVDAVLAASGDAAAPEGVVIRELSGTDDFARIVRLQETVWGEGMAWLGRDLAAAHAAEPDGLRFFLAALPEGELASAGWLHLHRGTEFASLWGGATLPDWRGRGIYRALVARRAAVAAELGYRFLQVDASPESRPILERLGLRVVTTTTPYVRRPGGAR